MAEQRTLILLVAGSVGVVALMVAMLRGGEPARPAVAKATDTAVQQPLGVRDAEADSARRGRPDADDGAAGPPQLPAIAPVAANSEEPPPREPVEPPAPAEPIVPSADDEAAADAVAAVMPRVKAEVEDAIESRRRAIRNACWSGGKAASATFPTQASFGPDGGLLALSIADDRAAPGVGECVRAQPLPIKIDPPGVPVTVAVAVTLP